MVVGGVKCWDHMIDIGDVSAEMLKSKLTSSKLERVFFFIYIYSAYYMAISYSFGNSCGD